MQLCVANSLDGQPKDAWFPLKKKAQGIVAAAMSGSDAPALRLRFHADVRIPLVWPGQFVAVPSPSITLGLGWDVSKKERIDLDASVVGLDAAGNIVDKVWYRQLQGFGGAVQHKGDNQSGEGDGDDEEVVMALDRIAPHVVALVILIDSFTKVPLTKVKTAYIRIRDNITGATFAFCRLSKMSPSCGLFFGCFYREVRFCSTRPRGSLGWRACPALSETAIVPENQRCMACSLTIMCLVARSYRLLCVGTAGCHWPFLLPHRRDAL